MAYQFSGADPQVRFSIGAFSGYNFRQSAQSFAALLKRDGTGTWDGVVTIDNGGTGVYNDSLEIDPTNQLAYFNGNAVSAGSSAGTTLNDTTNWMILAFSWAGSGNTGRFDWQVGGGTWGSTTTGTLTETTPSNAGSGFRWVLGNDPSLGDDAVFEMVCAGAIKSALAQATVQSLTITDFASWQTVFTGATAALWGFDTISSQVDRTGNGADEVTRNNVTLVSDPPGWSWGGTTAAPMMAPAFQAVPFMGH